MVPRNFTTFRVVPRETGGLIALLSYRVRNDLRGQRSAADPAEPVVVQAPRATQIPERTEAEKVRFMRVLSNRIA